MPVIVGTPPFNYGVTVEADLTGSTAFGAAAHWTDVTADVLTTGIGDAIEIDDWRQDELTDVSPSTLDLTVDNHTGTYTPGATGITPMSSRWRVTVTVNGVSTVIFDGYATSFVGAFASVVRPVTRVHCVDILAVFGKRTPLRSIYVEEVLADAPYAFYPLDETDGATGAGDLTGQRPAATVKTSKYGAGTLTFGAESLVVGQSGMMAVTSPDVDTVTSAARATYLAIPAAAVPSTAPFTFEAIFVGDAANVTHDEYLLFAPGLDGTSGGGQVAVEIMANGWLAWSITGATTPLSTHGTTSVMDGNIHHVALVLAADGKSASLYLDGVADSTATSPVNIAWASGNNGINVGVLLNGSQVYAPFGGRIAGVTTFNTAETFTRIAAHYLAAKTAFAGESTNGHVARLLTYRANLGSDLDTGVGTVGVHDTNGVTLADALLATGKAEAGVVYAKAGRIQLRNRSRLFNPAVAVTLDASVAGQVTPDIAPRIDDQGVVNDATISRPLGADQRVVNAASVALFGTSDGSDTRIVNSDQSALDIANYIVANYKTPKADTPSVTVNMASLSLSDPTKAQQVLALNPLDRLAVSNLPATSPALDGFVQGRHISLAVDAFDVTFNLSPLTLPVMVADDAVLGICDSVNVAAF